MNLSGCVAKIYGVAIESDKILHQPLLLCCFLEGLMFVFLLKNYFLKFNLSYKNTFSNHTFLYSTNVNQIHQAQGN